MAISHFDVHTPIFGSILFPRITVTTTNTAANLALTAAQLLGGLILRDCNGSARTDTLPTAAAVVDAVEGCQVGQAFEFTVRNTSSTAVAITIAAATTATTISGTATIAQLNSKTFLCVLTNVTLGSETMTVYSMGSVVF